MVTAFCILEAIVLIEIRGAGLSATGIIIVILEEKTTGGRAIKTGINRSGSRIVLITAETELVIRNTGGFRHRRPATK